jgi:hypothetical protein
LPSFLASFSCLSSPVSATIALAPK